MDKSAEYQKRKKGKELFRNIIINVVIWLIIITFVATIGVTWNTKGQGDGGDIKVAEINGKTYSYKPSSPYYYIYNGVRDTASKRSLGKLSDAAFRVLVASNSIETLQNYAILAGVAEKNGIKPSREMVKSIVNYILSGRDASVGSGLLDYVNMEYYNSALAQNNGDLLNAFSPVTVGELYSYFDLVNFTVEADILYVNIEEYIISRIKDADIEPFFESNRMAFIYEAVVEDLSISNKPLAVEIFSNIQASGWDKALETYKGRYSNTPSLVLSETNTMAKRFQLAVSNKAGDILPRPVYENGLYHIVRIKSFPTLGTMRADVKREVFDEYVMKNYKELKAKYTPEIEASVKQAEELARTSPDWKTVSAKTGVNYLKTGRTAPINQLLRDSLSNRIELPILQNDSWFDFFFGAEKGQVSPVLRDENWYAIIRPVYKGVNPSISYENIDQDVALRYINFKNVSITRDWFFKLKDAAKIKLIDTGIAKLTETSKDGEEQ